MASQKSYGEDKDFAQIAETLRNQGVTSAPVSPTPPPVFKSEEQHVDPDKALLAKVKKSLEDHAPKPLPPAALEALTAVGKNMESFGNTLIEGAHLIEKHEEAFPPVSRILDTGVKQTAPVIPGRKSGWEK